MYATELQTVINNPYIKIPEYEKLQGQKVRVIFLVEQVEQSDKSYYKKEKEEDFIEYLINNPIDIPKDMKFLSREEANER